MKNYSWKINFYNEDANEVGKELEEIENTSELNAENTVEYAKNPNTTLNKLFEWDNEKAGHKYRLYQARQIINNIQVEIIKSDNEKGQIKAFVKTTKAHKENYKNIEAVVSDTEQYQMLLGKAYAELNCTKNRYKELEEIQDLLKDMPEIY